MWPYWLIYLPVAFAALIGEQARPSETPRGRREPWSLAWWVAAVAITLAIGFRYRVGGDWWNYIAQLDRLRGVSLAEAVESNDPGYELANWFSLTMDWEIFGVNLICGGLLTAGLVEFCRNMPRPWLALAVSIPYLVIVVGMGYSRQGVALGMVMLGLVALQRKSTLWFVTWVVFGATFHKTAVLLLPIAALANTTNRYWTAAWVGGVTLSAYVLLLQDAVESMYTGYVEAEYQSEGALVRLLMNALPAGILLLGWKRLRFSAEEGPLWRWLAIISLALLALLAASPSSTAVDRIALYMLPLQLVVFSYGPELMGGSERSNQGWVALILAYYASVLFVWLNFATHARVWIPYRFYPLEIL